jgi:hypothetical protein
MHPSSVIEGKPVDDLVLGLALGLEAHAMQALDARSPWLTSADALYRLNFPEMVPAVAGAAVCA